MKVSLELKEIREMLHKITKDLTKIRQAQKQMKEEMYEVKDDLRRFKEVWKKEKAEMEGRVQKLEEEKLRAELTERLRRCEQLGEAIELKEKRSNSNISSWDEPSKSKLLQECKLGLRLDNLARRQKNHGSTVNIKYEKLCTEEKGADTGTAPGLIKQIFRTGRTDL